MKIHRGADEAGLVAELCKIPVMISKRTHYVCSMIVSTGNFPSSWSTFFSDDGIDGARPTTI